MPLSGGTFTRNHDFTADAANNVKIRADRMDEEFDDIAAALSAALYRDGSAAATGNLNVGGNRVTNLSVPTVGTDAATKAYVDSLITSTATVTNSIQGVSVDIETNAIITTGWAVPGDAPLALWVRVDSQPSHPARVRSSDRAISDGTIDEVNGGWWELSTDRPDPRMIGAKCDRVEIQAAATIDSGSTTLTVTGASFTNDDAGKHILVSGAGADGIALRTTIDSVTSATEVELTDAASATVSGEDIYYASDDAPAFVNCWRYAVAKQRLVSLGSGATYSLMDPEASEMADGALLTLASGDKRTGIIGAGKFSSEVFFNDPPRSEWFGSFFDGRNSKSAQGFAHDITFKSFHYRGPWYYYRKQNIPALPDHLEQQGGQFGITWRVHNFHIEDMALTDVRGQLTWARYCKNYTARNNYVRRVQGGGFIGTDCENFVVEGNDMAFITDDSIFFGSRLDITDISVNGTREYGVRTARVQNNSLEFCGLIKCQHAHNAVIQGNTHQFGLRGAIWVRTASSDEPNGGVASVSILGNTVTNCFDTSQIPEIESSGSVAIWVVAESRAGTTVTGIPGMPDADGSIVDLQEHLTRWSPDTDTDTPIGPVIGIDVSHNTIERTLPPVTNFSDYDFQYFDALRDPVNTAFLKENYQINFEVTLAALRPGGIFIDGPHVRGVRVHNNIMMGIGTAHRIRGDNNFTEPVVSETVISNTTAIDVFRGVSFDTEDAGNVVATIRDSYFSGDPYFRVTGRNTDGSWTAVDDAEAIIEVGNAGNMRRRGVTFENVTFSHWSAVTDASNAENELFRYNWKGCILECDPVAFGFDVGNKGIGRLPKIGPCFNVHLIDSDPTSASFGESINETYYYAEVSPPSSGKYVTGQEVWNIDWAGEDDVPVMWRRLTIGTDHVVGTDWLPVYARTTPPDEVPLSAPRNISRKFQGVSVADGDVFSIYRRGDTSRSGLLRATAGGGLEAVEGLVAFGAKVQLTTGPLSNGGEVGDDVIISRDGADIWIKNLDDTADYIFSRVRTPAEQLATSAGVDVQADGSVYPDTDGTATFGAVDRRWAEGWFDEVFIGGNQTDGFRAFSDGAVSTISLGSITSEARLLLEWDRSTGLLTFSTGLVGSETPRVRLENAGVFRPAADGGTNLGTTTVRWGAVYSDEYVATSYTVATLPAGQVGAWTYCSDGAAGSPIMAFHDGTGWRRSDTGGAVSAT